VPQVHSWCEDRQALPSKPCDRSEEVQVLPASQIHEKRRRVMTRLPDGIIVENWTTHPVNLITLEGKITIPLAQGAPARMLRRYEKTSSPYLSKMVIEKQNNLPCQRDGVYLIVSALVKNSMPERDDLIVPNNMIRDKGEVIGCFGFGV